LSLLGIDVGTSRCKAGVFSPAGDCLASAYRAYDLRHPQPGWAELDSTEVWQAVKAVIAEAAAGSGRDPVTALSVSALGEAFVPVTRDRELLGPSILSMDPRGAEHAARLRHDYGQERFYGINPNLIGPNYALPKLLWLREHQPDVWCRADYFLLWSDLVAFMLGCDPVTNASHANRTLLFDLARGDWSTELLGWSGIPAEKLGTVVPGGAIIGTVAPSMAAALGLPHGVQVVAGGHDQCCNALGCGGILAGRAVYGLGSYDCITPVYRQPAEPQAFMRANLNIEHHVVPDLFVSFLYNQGGLLTKWFRDTFAADDPTPGGAAFARLDAEMPAQPTRLLVLPHFDPPPFHAEPTAGVIVGLKADTRRGEILKAICEGTAFHFVDGIQALCRLGIDTTEFIASGGGARSDAGLQLRAEVLGVPFVRPRITEAGILGAALLAGIATGVYRDAADAVEAGVRRDRVFEPDAGRHALYRARHAQFRQLFPALQTILNDLASTDQGTIHP
jgi:xylulokinase